MHGALVEREKSVDVTLKGCDKATDVRRPREEPFDPQAPALAPEVPTVLPALPPAGRTVAPVGPTPKLRRQQLDPAPRRKG